jgi:hypothetical protein
MPGVGGAGSRLLRTFAPCLQPNEPRATASGAGDAQQVTESPQNQGGFLRARDVASRMRFAPAGRAQSSHRIDPTHLGFGPEVDRLVHKSTTLTAQLRSARAAGYRVSAGGAGRGILSGHNYTIYCDGPWSEYGLNKGQHKNYAVRWKK